MFTLYDAEVQFRATLSAAAEQINQQMYSTLRAVDAADVAVSLGGPDFHEFCIEARLAAEYAYDLRKVAMTARHGLVAMGLCTGEDDDTYRVVVNDCDTMLALMAKVRMLQDQREAIEF